MIEGPSKNFGESHDGRSKRKFWAYRQQKFTALHKRIEISLEKGLEHALKDLYCKKSCKLQIRFSLDWCLKQQIFLSVKGSLP